MSEKQQTARRILIFVGLTWMVIFLTPRLFPSRTPPVEPVTAPVPLNVADSAASASIAAALPTNVPVQGQNTFSVPPESISVSTSLGGYTFTSRGATAVSVQLERFHSLRSETGPVELLRSGDALVQYSIVSGGDTLNLSKAAFVSAVERNTTGAVERIRYTAPVTVAGTAGTLLLEYNFAPDSYVVRVSGRIDGLSGRAFLLAQLPMGLRSNEADSVEDERHFAVAYKPVQGDAQGIAFGKLNPGEQRLENRQPLSWVAVKSKYFIVGLLKPEGEPGFAELQVVGGPRISRSATQVAAYVVDDISEGSFSFEIFAGPQEFNRLAALGRDFQNSNPYGGFLQPLVQPFAFIVMKALLWLRNTTNLNYGWVLVIFGVLIRLMLWPLNQKAMRTSLRMQRLQPELQEIQKRLKGNPQKQQEEIMRVYRDHGMTPFSPLAGCLPMLIPMPVLFALFFVFQNTIEFRGVSFLWLPDISQKDPYYIVPLFMGISMFVMSWLGARNSPQNPQAKMMLYFLPIMFTVLFLNFASGLNLYYAVQNVAALPQQWLIAREKMKAEGPTPKGKVAARSGPKGRSREKS